MWAAVIAVALAGAIGFEIAGDTFETYPLTWEQTRLEHLVQDGSLAEGERLTQPIDLRYDNLTEIRAVVEWTDDAGEPDRFEVGLSAPNGSQVAMAEGTESPLTVPVTVHPMPQWGTIEATAHEAARQQVIEDHATRTNGTWTVVVELVEAPGSRAAPGTPETQEDGANGFTLTVEIVTYRAVVERP